MDDDLLRIGSLQDTRVFSLADAQALFPLVRGITQRAAEELADAAFARRARFEPDLMRLEEVIRIGLSRRCSGN